MKNEYKRRAKRGRRGMLMAALLAIMSGGGSIAIAIAVGWQRGAVVSDQILLAVVNVIAVLAAQFLPALAMQLPLAKKGACVVLWLVCVAYSLLGHAWYLLAAQERSGLARAQAILTAAKPADSSTRDRVTILNDKVRVADQLARLPAWTCEDACAERQRLRKAALAERLTALDAELQAGAEAQQGRVQLDAQARQAKEDLVGARLASSLGVTYANATWIMALTYALILEGVGCLCWAIVFKPETSEMTVTTETAETSVTIQSPQPLDVTVGPASHDLHGEAAEQSSDEVVPPSAASDSPTHVLETGRSWAADFDRVESAVRDSQIRLTVNQIRAFLCCSQKWAQALRKAVAERESAACDTP